VVERVRVVVLCWNNAGILDRCLRHLLATDWPRQLHVVVVDNGSTDGSVDRWSERHPSIELVETSTKSGNASRARKAGPPPTARSERWCT
jgi:glycosyltransferase involved in cell wall biosynthesis